MDKKFLDDIKLKKSKYNRYKKQNINWRRPKVEDVAKEMQIKDLYDFGYDYASTHVHPMANDGLRDFYIVTGLEQIPYFPDQLKILNNSLRVLLMILTEATSDSSLKWRQMIFEYIEDMKKCCIDFDETHFNRHIKIANLFEKNELAKIN